MDPLFSVIIPVYNAKKYLDECIDSVLVQMNTITPTMDIILVDDGSTDGSSALCDDYANRYDHVRVIHQENQGSFAARRAGFKVSRGKYIICLDSDDMLVKDTISSLAETFQSSDADVVFYNISIMRTSETKPYYMDVFTKGNGCQLTKEQVLLAFFNYEIPVVTSTAGKAFKRECLNIEYDYSDFTKLSMGDDTLLTAEIVSRASSFYYLNKNLYIYRMGTGMTAKFDPEYFNSFRKIIIEAKSMKNFADTEKYGQNYNEKIISSACRAITQSKTAKMSYTERKKYINSVFEDEVYKEAFSQTDLKMANIKEKYKIIIRLVKVHAYLPLHIALKIMN